MNSDSLKRLVSSRPGVAEIPIMLLDGKPMTPKQLMYLMERGLLPEEKIIEIFSSEATTDEIWLLTENFYSRLLKTPAKDIRLATFSLTPSGIPASMTLHECYDHVVARDDVGRWLTQLFSRLLIQIYAWLS